MKHDDMMALGVIATMLLLGVAIVIPNVNTTTTQIAGASSDYNGDLDRIMDQQCQEQSCDLSQLRERLSQDSAREQDRTISQDCSCQDAKYEWDWARDHKIL